MSAAHDDPSRGADADRRRDWRLLLPPGWASLRARDLADEAPRSPALALLADHLRAAADPAADPAAGTCSVHVLRDGLPGVEGVDVTAALVVSQPPGPAPEGAEALLGPAVGVLESGPVAIAGLTGVRRRRRVLIVEGEAAGGWATHLEVLLLDREQRPLLLLFTTVSDDVAGELVALFDAIAGSLHRAETVASA